MLCSLQQQSFQADQVTGATVDPRVGRWCDPWTMLWKERKVNDWNMLNLIGFVGDTVKWQDFFCRALMYRALVVHQRFQNVDIPRSL